jgi:hypothetical protein
MHSDARGGFDRFQIESARLALTAADGFEQRVYFGADFLLDRFRRFFSAGSQDSSTGRAWQIFSFTSSNSLLSSRKRWNASTSRSALRKAAGEENVSLTVLPFTFRVRR